MRNMTMFVTALAIAAPALAVTVPTTGDFSVPLPGTTSAADPSLAGANVSDTIVPFASAPGVTPAVSGKVQVRVARSTSTGNLIYSYRITSNATSTGPANAFQVIGFPAAGYDGNWRSDGLGAVSPATLSGTTNASLGRILAFQFAGGLQPGKDSKFFFLKTSKPGQDSAKAIGRIKAPGGNIDIQIPKPTAS